LDDSLTELQRLRVEGDGKQLDLARANFAVASGVAHAWRPARPTRAPARQQPGESLHEIRRRRAASMRCARR
jgi:hypothetical protein